MNKYIIPIMVVLLLLSSSFVGVSNDIVEKSSIMFYDGITLYVGGSGTGNYTRIQDAIDNTSDGDTVFVFDDSSPYYENLVIYRSINLVGEDRDSTVIDGDGIDSVIEVSANHVCIEGFTITNCKHDLSEAGINIFSDWNTIKNNNIMENQRTGIRLSNSHYNLIENNTFKDNILYHIYLKDESNNNTIQNNNLTLSNNWSYACEGIWLTKSSDNLILNNEITGLKFSVGISLYETSGHNIVNKNRIHNNPCDDEAISIQIYDHSDFNLIIDNEIKSNNGCGIMMLFSQGNEIIGNTIEFLPLQGIALGDCRYNNIIKLNSISSTEKGIDIGMYSSKNIIESNNLTSNTYGIYLSGTDLLGFFPNNVISKNNIVENEYGIYITISKYYGYSNDSLIYHNNFIDNTQNAYDICNNSWDNGYPSGGNFWNDYNGTDDDGDGIGDTPYPIPGGDNEDKYPLMEPWSSENQPPSAPYIDGPTKGKPGIDYNYTFVTTDPDGDYVWYYICWGDKEIIYIYGPYPSGEEITLSYNWSEKGIYIISCWARDIFDAESNITTLDVTIPRNKAINKPIPNFLQSHPNLFPILQKLLLLIK